MSDVENLGKTGENGKVIYETAIADAISEFVNQWQRDVQSAMDEEINKCRTEWTGQIFNSYDGLDRKIKPLCDQIYLSTVAFSLEKNFNLLLQNLLKISGLYGQRELDATDVPLLKSLLTPSVSSIDIANVLAFGTGDKLEWAGITAGLGGIGGTVLPGVGTILGASGGFLFGMVTPGVARYSKVLKSASSELSRATSGAYNSLVLKKDAAVDFIVKRTKR